MPARNVEKNPKMTVEPDKPIEDQEIEFSGDIGSPELPPIDIGGPSLPPAETSIYSAFIRAQSKIGNVAKNAKNEFFKTPKGKPSGFVDLAGLNDAVLPVLTEHGLGFQQRMAYSDGQAFVVSQVIHESGETLPESWYPVITKDANDPQKFGAGVTYARRYSMMAYFSIAAEDDDGNLAATPPKKEESAKDKLKKELVSMKADGSKFKEMAKNAKVSAEKFADLTEEQAQKMLDSIQGGVPF